MADLFKLGDVVQMKSGGPLMTVNGLPSEISNWDKKPRGVYDCVWFIVTNKKTGKFAEHLLKAAVEPGDSI